MDRTHRDFLFMVGYEYLRQNRHDKALTLFHGLLAAGDNRCRVLLAVSYCLLQERRFPEALEHAEQAVAFSGHEELRFSLLLKARALLHLGRIEDGRAVMATIAGI